MSKHQLLQQKNTRGNQEVETAIKQYTIACTSSGGFRGDGGMHPPHQPKRNVHMNNTYGTLFKKSNQ